MRGCGDGFGPPPRPLIVAHGFLTEQKAFAGRIYKVRIRSVVNAYIGIKLLHISAIMVWCAALFYLPGLFAAHPSVPHKAAGRRLLGRTRLVYAGVASPAAVIAVLSGSALVLVADSLGGWLVLKLLAVTGMVLIHVYFGRLTERLEQAPALRSPLMHLLLLVPAGLMIIAVIYLVTAKPV